MTIEFAYWHWLVLGMALITLEMFIPTFTIIWFGAGALVVGALMFVMPAMSLPWQIFIWATASIAMTVLWFKFLKPLSKDKTSAGMSREALVGATGQVIALPTEHKRGMMRFSVPVLGAEEWSFICQEKIMTGDRVIVTDVSGNTLIVQKA